MIAQKLISPAEAYRQNVARPMRWPRMEKLAKTFYGEFAKRHVNPQRDLFDSLNIALPGFPKWQTVHQSEQGKNFVPVYFVDDHKCGPNCKHETQKKAYFSEEEVREIMQELDNVSPGLSALLENAYNGLLTAIMLGSIGGQLLIEAFYQSGITEALRKARDIAIGSGKRQGGPELEMILRERDAFVFDPNAPFIKEIMDNGFKLIRHKVTLDFKPSAAKIIIDGAEAGRSWNVIARDLYKKSTLEPLYHWNRLVRTEYATAIASSQIAQYGKLGAKKKKYSAASGQCPICAGYQGKIYALNHGPILTADTHPNCRCMWLPIFS